MKDTVEQELAAAEERANNLRALRDLLAQRESLDGDVTALQAEKDRLEAEKARLEHDAKTREKFRDEDLYRAAQAGTFLLESTKLPPAATERFDLLRRFLRLRGWLCDASAWKWRDAPAAAYTTLDDAFRQQVSADMQPFRPELFGAATQSTTGG